MPLRTGRLGRPGVIDCPIARIAALAGSAAAIARGVERRQDRVVELSADPNHREPGDPARTTVRSTDP